MPNRKARRLAARGKNQDPGKCTWIPKEGEWHTCYYCNKEREDEREAEEAKIPKIPGVNIPPVDPEFEAKVARNSWHEPEELDEVIATIKQLSKERPWGRPLIKPIGEPEPEDAEENRWSWAYNHNCKYINIRIDMRDGGFTLSNDTDGRINLERLKWQYKSLEEYEKEKAKNAQT